MNKKILFTLILVLVTVVTFQTQAQPEIRHDAHHCIHRTAMVLIETQRIVRAGKVYTGDFARAVDHQRFAKKLFAEGKFVRAIHQSIRARNLAFAAIAANKAEIKAEWRFDEGEQRYAKSVPADKDLDGEVHNYGKQKDADVLNVDLSADVDVAKEK